MKKFFPGAVIPISLEFFRGLGQKTPRFPKVNGEQSGKNQMLAAKSWTREHFPLIIVLDGSDKPILKSKTFAKISFGEPPKYFCDKRFVLSVEICHKSWNTRTHVKMGSLRILAKRVVFKTVMESRDEDFFRRERQKKTVHVKKGF